MISTEQVHLLLQQPRLIATRVDEMVRNRFIGDQLLTGRFDAVGGAIAFDHGTRAVDDDEVGRLDAGSEYPMVVISDENPTVVATEKFGLSTEVFDEAIARMAVNPVDRALRGIVDALVAATDGVTLAIIRSALAGNTFTSTAWSTGAAIVENVLSAKAQAEVAGTAIYDCAVISPLHYAKAMGKLVADGVLPRESGNPITSRTAPELFGITWIVSPAWTGAPALIDRARLGAIAAERLGSPGWVTGTGNTVTGVETSVERLHGRDGYRLAARRVYAPIVLDPEAGISIEGTGLTGP